MTSPQIVVLGGHVQGFFLRVERFPRADETVLASEFEEPEDGGKGSHQAIACARLGASTAFVGCVGADRAGDRAVEWLMRDGVNTTHLVRTRDAPTGVGIVMLDPKGTPAIVTSLGANACLTPAHVEAAERLMRGARVVLVSMEIPLATVLEAVRIGSHSGARVILNPAPAGHLPKDAVDGVYVLTPNETEAQQLLDLDVGASPTEMGLQLRHRYHVPHVVLTRGERGVVLVEDEDVRELPAIPVRAVDTVGAGDAFNAGLAVALAGGASPQDAVEVGMLAGAYSVTQRGSLASLPTLRSLVTFAAHCGRRLPSGLLASSASRKLLFPSP